MAVERSGDVRAFRRDHGLSRRIPAAAVCGSAVAAGILVHPWATVGAVATLLLAAVCRVGRDSELPRVFLVALGLLLLGYAFLGKGFAYLGYAPLYIGEAVLGLGFLAAVLGGGVRPLLRMPLTWLVVSFMLWGALRTLPYLATYRVDALRDAVLWGYAAFALATAWALLRTGWLPRAVSGYARVLPWLLLWIPVGLLVFEFFPRALPAVPGSGGVAILHLKPGDMAVHLAGCTTFFVLGLHRTGRERARPLPWEWIWWAAVLAGFVLAGSQNRGGMFAFVAAFAVISLRGGFRSLWKPLLLGTIATSLFLFVGAQLDFGKGRRISPQQIMANVESTFGGSSRPVLDGTREWRLQWWTDIVDYTFFGGYFWTGKGFGINLADDDGYQVHRRGKLRSPHNGHLSVLARAGVPGLGLWVLMQGVFALSLLRAHLRARATGRDGWARFDLWILAYWTAFVVNASFDVFLEGPQAGICFWSLFGCGIAALELQRRELREAAASPFPPARTFRTGGREAWVTRGRETRVATIC